MTASVRISRRAAEGLLSYIDTLHSQGEAVWSRAHLDELRRALEVRPKSSQVKRTEKKRRAKSASTKEIRAAVMERADGKCEACGVSPPTDLHHVFGRVRVPQSVRNCLALCRVCHSRFTDNMPSAVVCWGFAAQLLRGLGFIPEAERCAARADALRLTRGET